MTEEAGQLTAMILLKMMANAGWIPPLMIAAIQPNKIQSHSGPFIFIRRVNGAGGSFSSSYNDDFTKKKMVMSMLKKKRTPPSYSN